jgi:K+-transporting ATPase KdpF subunit
VTIENFVALALAAAVTAYLVAALLFPEKF